MAKKKARAAKRSKAKKASKPAAKKATAGRAAVSPKQQFLHRYGMEHATTLRVLRAIPPGQGDFRPHPRSQSASELVHTMLFELELGRRAIGDGPIMGGGSAPPKPASLEAGIEALDKSYQAVVEEIKKTSDAKLQRTIQFPVSKGQMGDWSALDFMWYIMVLDHVHHRGQLSVYVRLAGGKVPSIYGPSGDDPWT
jgi:uncharacterized damage-inducible protein DinB